MSVINVSVVIRTVLKYNKRNRIRKGDNMRNANPYTPGAGFKPAYLAGREHAVENARKVMHALQQRYPQRSIVYYGLRGVGKTVLLNRIEEIAEEYNIIYDHIEVKEKSGFINQLTKTAYKFLRQISREERVKELGNKIMMAIKSLSVTYNPQEGSFSAGLGELQGIINPDDLLADNLTDVFLSLGYAAEKSGDTIVIFIDEIQYLKKVELEALVNALHRVNQKRLPIMIFGAGLPKIFKELGEAKSYSERLFQFEEVGALEPQEAELAITEPAKDQNVFYAKEAVRRIVEITEGYPYFIQEYCKIIWDISEEVNKIELSHVLEAEESFYKALDGGFFKVRYERCTAKEIKFMLAMVKCGELPCTISNVAQILGSKVNAISPVRAQLISKGLIYATRHGEIDFTVPQFDNFLRRIEE